MTPGRIRISISCRTQRTLAALFHVFHSSAVKNRNLHLCGFHIADLFFNRLDWLLCWKSCRILQSAGDETKHHPSSKRLSCLPCIRRSLDEPLAGGPGGKSQLSRFKDHRAQVWWSHRGPEPLENKVHRVILPEAIRQSCLNLRSGISREDRELRVPPKQWKRRRRRMRTRRRTRSSSPWSFFICVVLYLSCRLASLYSADSLYAWTLTMMRLPLYGFQVDR